MNHNLLIRYMTGFIYYDSPKDWHARTNAKVLLDDSTQLSIQRKMEQDPANWMIKS